MRKEVEVNSLILLPVLFPEVLFLIFALGDNGFSTDGFIQLLLFVFFKGATVLIVGERFCYYGKNGWSKAVGIGRKGSSVIRISWWQVIVLALPCAVLLSLIAFNWADYQQRPLLFYQGELAAAALLVAFVWYRGLKNGKKNK